MNGPLVSICIPTYNRRELLLRALKSCFAQTHQNFEIIITDNSDNDETAQMIASLKDPRIHYHKNEKNLGSVGNLTKAVTLGTGKYLKLLMDDDLLRINSLELMVDAFEKNPTVGVVMAPMDLIDADDKRFFPTFYVVRKMHYRFRYQVGTGFVDRKRVLRDFLTMENLHDYPCCVPSAIMYRTECFKKLGVFDPKSKFGIDLEMVMRIATENDFYYIDEVLSSFRYLPISDTFKLQSKGFPLDAYYHITRKTLANPHVVELFKGEMEKLERDSIYFCSCRALLNVISGFSGRNPKLVIDTLKFIWKEDPYFCNKLRLPWFVVREVLISFAQPKQPLPKETEINSEVR